MKFAGIFAGFGFLLSLICSISSGSGAGRVILLAVIFALVFAALGFGIGYLYESFLGTESSGEINSEGAAPEGGKKGQVVDVVIHDEDLPSDEVTGQYYVGTNHQMLTPEDVNGGFGTSIPSQAYSRQNAVADTIRNENKMAVNSNPENADTDFAEGTGNSSKGFVPVRNLETLYNVSGKEAVTKDNPAQAQASFSPSSEGTFSAADEQLDVLPSMENLGIDNSSSSENHEEGINSESDFATSGGTSVHREPEETEIKDAPLMAKAISSILANES